MFDYNPETFLYLASPYTHNDPAVRQWRYEQAVAAAATLAKRQIWTYSPIAHSHEMCLKHDMPYTFEFWDSWNQAMILGSAGLLVLRMDGWDTSKGIAAEIRFASEQRKPIDYLEWLHKYDPVP